MKRSIPKFILTLFMLCLAVTTKAQLAAGDLVFTGFNIFDDNVNGSTQNDVFSFVMLKKCPANTTIYFTDLGLYNGSSFQNLNCGTGNGAQSDGIIKWVSPNYDLPPGKQIVIKSKYSPSATIGTVTAVTATKLKASTYVSLGLAGDQLFAYLSSNGDPSASLQLLAGVNINKKTWETSFDPCMLTSSKSAKPTETATLKFPSIYAVNGRYNCLKVVGSSAGLRTLLTDSTNWNKDYTQSTSFPASFNLSTTAPCDLVVVNPDANGIVYVDINTTTPGDGSSWAAPVKELRDALTVANESGSPIKQIWVAKGTYLTGASGAMCIIPTGVSIYGGFKTGGDATLAARQPSRNPVILSGDVGNDDTKLNGITLNATDIGGTPNTNTWLGVPAYATNIQLDNLIFTGAALNAINILSYANVTVTNTRFMGNGSGIVVSPSASLITKNTAFYGNGTAIQSDGTLNLQNITIAGNNNGLITSNTNVTATNCIISNNKLANTINNNFTIKYTLIDNILYTPAGQEPAVTVKFVNITTGDLRLDSSSRIINRGDPATNTTGINVGNMDLADSVRINNSIIDLGAYEYQAQKPTIAFAALGLTYGDKVQLHVTTNSDGVVLYTSDNPAVTVISGDSLFAKGTGSISVHAQTLASRAYLPSDMVSANVVINPKDLQVHARDTTREYNTANPVTPNIEWSGFAFNDNPAIFSQQPTVTYGATAASPVGTYPITLNIAGVGNSNYTLHPFNGVLTVAKANQVITAPAGLIKKYGDAPFDPGATISSGQAITYTLVSGPGAISGNQLTIIGAGTIKVTASQPGGSNYNAAADVTFDIIVNKAEAIITANNASRNYGDANPSFTYSLGSLVNAGDLSMITGSPVLATAATNTSAPGAYDITVAPGTLASDNYTFRLVKGTLTISKANQTITFNSLTNKTYGDAAFDLSATASSLLPVTYTVSGPATISGKTLTITGAGTVTVTAIQNGDVNYLAATNVQQSFTVAKAALTVTADDKQGLFNQAIPALTYQVTGFVNGETAAVITGNAVLATTAINGSPVGVYPITTDVSGMNAANYTISGANGQLTIVIATQVISFNPPASKTYGDASFALSASSTSGLTTSITLVSGPATLNGNMLTITGAGNIVVEASQAGNANYDAATTVSKTITVQKAILTVKANDFSRAYGEANPIFDAAITGWVNGDLPAVVSGTPALSTIATTTSNTGAYDIDITSGSLSAANYDFILIKGTLTIGKANQTITFNNLTNKTYGDAAFDISATASSLLPVTYTVSGPAVISGKTLTITGAGNITVTAIQNGDGNYLTATNMQQSFTVAKASLTVTADDKQVLYNQAIPTLTYQITGYVNGETAAVIIGSAVVATTATNGSTVGVYPITTDVSAMSAPNYTISAVNGQLTIGKSTQVITFTPPASKIYGDAPFALSASSTSGLPTTITLVSGPAILNGNMLTITGAGNVIVEASQAGNANYEAATTVSKTITVQKATLTVKANDFSRAYGEANPIFDAAITGWVNGDLPAVVSGTPALSTIATTTSNTGAYDIDITSGSLSAANYDFILIKGTLTIGKANQTITFNNLTNKTYGDAAFDLSATANSLLPVTYTVSGPATISGKTLTITGAGVVTVTAIQNGDGNYLAATNVQQSFTVARATLTVTADDKQVLYNQAIPALTYQITGYVNGETAAVITGSAGVATTASNGSTVGVYPITTDVSGMSAANYTIIGVNGQLTISRNSQQITFTQPADKTYGDAPFALSASSNSGLQVSFSVVSGPATISGNTVTITGAGTVVIAANQVGNNDYDPATGINKSFLVNKAAVTVTAHIAEKVYDGQPYSGGNGVDYLGLVNNDQPVVLGTVSYGGSSQGAINTGSYDINPQVPGNDNYTVTYTASQLTIKKAKQTITFTTIGDKNEGDPQFTISATASSGLPVNINSDNATVIIVSGNTGTVGSAGTATITVTQQGDNNYEAATPVTQTITVTAYPVPEITADGQLQFCDKSSLLLKASPAPAYAWYKDGVKINGASSATYQATSSGMYLVHAIYPGQEKASIPVSVTVYPLPVVDIQASSATIISKGATITLMASGGDTYTWKPAEGLSNTTGAVTNARPTQNMTYTVTVGTSQGCFAEGAINIEVKDDYKLEASNILTPNGDGKNDYWIVKNIDLYPDNEVKIFDRAGRMVFQQRSYMNKWNGNMLAEGTYYYIITFGAGKPTFKGFITIIHD
ncbi:MBG domain-containing protein [Chitinophaga sp. Hz27]|uniref:MBG domain-containing protein n=1 Tax=Chitinophaga sp. Hz27 TaxID=3347169 RepID=UPI0035D8AA6C